VNSATDAAMRAAAWLTAIPRSNTAAVTNPFTLPAAWAIRRNRSAPASTSAVSGTTPQPVIMASIPGSRAAISGPVQLRPSSFIVTRAKERSLPYAWDVRIASRRGCGTVTSTFSSAISPP